MVILLGPGAYESKEGLTRKGGLMVTKDKRFRDLKSEGPGPGSYEVLTDDKNHSESTDLELPLPHSNLKLATSHPLHSRIKEMAKVPTDNVLSFFLLSTFLIHFTEGEKKCFAGSQQGKEVTWFQKYILIYMYM